ncbi:MAG: hypothetical protein ACI8W3_000518 [Myxococcota bacterium]|jgi:hypothetical protein
MRHAGLWLRGDTRWVIWTRAGEGPERILHRPPTGSATGGSGKIQSASRSFARSVTGKAPPNRSSPPLEAQSIAQADHLRDPFVFVDGGDSHLVYAIARKAGLANTQLQSRVATP